MFQSQSRQYDKDKDTKLSFDTYCALLPRLCNATRPSTAPGLPTLAPVPSCYRAAPARTAITAPGYIHSTYVSTPKSEPSKGVGDFCPGTRVQCFPQITGTCLSSPSSAGPFTGRIINYYMRTYHVHKKPGTRLQGYTRPLHSAIADGGRVAEDSGSRRRLPSLSCAPWSEAPCRTCRT